MVGRPREFDVQAALAKAMEVFWEKGYEATSIQNLVNAMGVNRGSMYDTFGDKHALFMAAINHYGRTVTRNIEQTLNGPGSVLGRIRKLLMGIGERGGGKCRGCLATNTIVELAPHDPEAAKTTRNLLRQIEKAIEETLDRAVAKGELSVGSDTRAQARFLSSVLQGLVVMSKAPAPRVVMNDTVNVAMSALR